MSEMKWQSLSVDALRPAAYNPRKKLKAGDKEYEKIKNSIFEYSCDIRPRILHHPGINPVTSGQRSCQIRPVFL